MAKLYFYYSAMNAGKSAMLLQSSHNYRERGMRTLLLAPRADLAHGAKTEIASRIGLRADALAFSADSDLHELLASQQPRPDCVLVDEAQFLTRAQVYQLSEIVDQFNIPVLSYGLRTDFRGELFEGSQYLLAWADELKEMKTICPTGSKATFVLRIDEHGEVIREGEQVEIGGNERYLSVCRREFKRRYHQR